MKLEFWGTRGSIPTPSGKTPEGNDINTYEFGGNTTCFRVVDNSSNEHIIDAGTGIRALGNYFTRRDGAKGSKLNLYFTHTHWDHIQGFPFFGPAYNPNSDISVFAEAKVKYDIGTTMEGHSEYDHSGKYVPAVLTIEGEGIKDVLKNQQVFRNFPAPLSALAGLKNFYDFIPGTKLSQGNLAINTQKLNHPGGCVGYSMKETQGGLLVITTDFEPDDNGEDYALMSFIEKADLWVADGQYETNSKNNPFMKGWGHSDPFWNVDLAIKTGVKKLLITHHEPKLSDNYHLDLEKRLQDYASEKLIEKKFNPKSLEVYLAREGSFYIL